MPRTPLSGLIILELEKGPATLEEIQTALTAARFNRGITKALAKLWKRKPKTIRHSFGQIPAHRIQRSLDMLIRNLRVQYYPRERFYALTQEEGARSVQHWKSRFASGAYK